MAATVGCNREADTRVDVEAIQDIEKQWNQDFASRDVDKLASYYKDDAVLMPPGSPPSVGRDSIRATVKQMLSDPALTLTFTAARVEVSRSGDLGYTRGAYVMTLTDPDSKELIQDHGSYVTIYRKASDGQWMAVSDIATSDAQPGK
jgi:uncharacterized protein (TIGR02246 family)